MKLDDDGVKKLTFAVLDQALKDYTDLLKSGKESNYSGSSLKEIERFFIDDPYDLLSDRRITGDDLINRLRKNPTYKKIYRK